MLPSFFFPLSRWMAGGAGVEYFPAPSRSGDCQSAPPETGLNRNRALWSVSVQFSIVAQLCPTLCDPMNRSTPDLPVHHQLPELTKIHIHRVGATIQPSQPVIPFSYLQYFTASGSFPMSQFFISGGQSIGVSASASVLPMNIQD